MKVFVTGATGFIGSHVSKQLLAEGHSVVGLCRSEEAAQKLKSVGVEPVIGDVKDPAGLEKVARTCDAVLHLAFIHDFANYELSCEIDLEVIRAFHRAVKGTKKPVIITSGTLIAGVSAPGETVDDTRDISQNPSHVARGKVDLLAFEFAKDGSNFSVIRLPPFVYGNNGDGFAKMQVRAAQKHGFAAYIGDGEAKSTSAHVEDAARAYVLGITKAQPGSAYHVSGEHFSYKDLATAIGKLVGVPTKSITKEEAAVHFGPLFAFIFAVNHCASGSRIEKELGWKKSNKVGILEDISNGSYKL